MPCTGEKSCNTAVAHQTFINTYMKFTVSENDYSGNGNGYGHDLVGLFMGWEVPESMSLIMPPIAAAPAPATKVDMEEGCITAKAADIPIKNVFFQAC